MLVLLLIHNLCQSYSVYCSSFKISGRCTPCSVPHSQSLLDLLSVLLLIHNLCQIYSVYCSLFIRTSRFTPCSLRLDRAEMLRSVRVIFIIITNVIITKFWYVCECIRTFWSTYCHQSPPFWGIRPFVYICICIIIHVISVIDHQNNLFFDFILHFLAL